MCRGSRTTNWLPLSLCLALGQDLPGIILATNSMPKAKGPKWYAVLIGRDGPQVYGDWEEVSQEIFTQEVELITRSYHSARSR